MTIEMLAATLVPLAWAVVLAAVETSAVALFAWCWLRTRNHRPTHRHAVAAGALVVCLTLALASYGVLLRAPGNPPPNRSAAVTARSQTATPPSAPGTAARRTTPPPPAAWRLPVSPIARQGLVIALAGGWLAATTVLLLRIIGGLLVIRRLRARARPVEPGRVQAACASAASRFELARVEWLQSAEIDAPAAVGWLRPAVLLPAGLSTSARDELLLPLLAHELEHVRRRDSLEAAALGAIEALLFHCPGVRWLSQQVRAAREEICDDVAVQVCGEPARCAEALATLVGVRRPIAALGAMGQGGPSLSARIRRILKGDQQVRRLTANQAFPLVLLAVAIAGSSVALASVALADSAAARGSQSVERPQRPPSAYLRTQPGAPVSITASLSDGRYVFQNTRVRNISEQRVTGLRFVAVLPDPRRASPVTIVQSEMIATSLEPGQAADLRVDLLPIESLGSGPQRAQPTLALLQARFEGDDEWAVVPDTRARDAEDALYIEKASVARALLGVKPAAAFPDEACMDHRGFPYSRGAVVPVLGSPGEWARCDKGTWVAYSLPTPPAAR